VHWSRIEDMLNQAGDLSGKVIVSCSLRIDADNTELVARTSSGVEELTKMPPLHVREPGPPIPRSAYPTSRPPSFRALSVGSQQSTRTVEADSAMSSGSHACRVLYFQSHTSLAPAFHGPLLTSRRSLPRPPLLRVSVASLPTSQRSNVK
jgi:hypothetical protein